MGIILLMGMGFIMAMIFKSTLTLKKDIFALQTTLETLQLELKTSMDGLEVLIKLERSASKEVKAKNAERVRKYRLKKKVGQLTAPELNFKEVMHTLVDNQEGRQAALSAKI